jgi:hypothetical protein
MSGDLASGSLSRFQGVAEKEDDLVKSVESLLAEKQAIAAREKKLIEDLNAVLGNGVSSGVNKRRRTCRHGNGKETRAGRRAPARGSRRRRRRRPDRQVQEFAIFNTSGRTTFAANGVGAAGAASAVFQRTATRRNPGTVAEARQRA